MIAAIDPGSAKTGMALLYSDGRLQWKEIVPSGEVEAYLAAALARYDLTAVVMGNGTHHKKMKTRAEAVLSERGFRIPVVLVDEKYTTEMGKEAWKKDHPPKGIRRFIPNGMRTVPVPVDDYVAWIIGRIYLGIVEPENIGHKKV